MGLKFYGKNTCVTCKKAKAFLESKKQAYTEFAIETQPPSKAVLEKLVDAQNVKASLNVRSAIYKAQKLGENLPDKKTAIALMLQDPNLIKRPVILDDQGRVYQGFEEASLTRFLKG